MRRIKTILPTAALGLLAVLPAVALADNTVYLGGGVGYHRLNEENFDNNANELDDSQVAYQGLLGARLHKFVGVEGSYVDFGTADNGTNRLDAHGFTAAGLGIVPLGPKVDLYGKVGALFWDKSGRRDNTASTPLDFDDDGEDPFYGIGARFGMTERVDFKLGYDRYEMDTTDVDLASANVQFNF